MSIIFLYQIKEVVKLDLPKNLYLNINILDNLDDRDVLDKSSR